MFNLPIIKYHLTYLQHTKIFTGHNDGSVIMSNLTIMDQSTAEKGNNGY